MRSIHPIGRQTQTAIEPLEPRKLLAFGGLPIQIGNNRFDMGSEVAATADGGFIAAGIFGNTVDFDPGAGISRLTSQGDTDIYIAKYDSAGALVWVRRIGGTARADAINDQERIDIASVPERAGGDFLNGVGADPKKAAEYVNDLFVDADGNVVVAGCFVGRNVDFNPGAGTLPFSTFDNEFYDAFIMKLDGDGDLVWAKEFGDRFTDNINAIAPDANGNIFLTGVFTRTVKFVPGNNSFNRTALGRADAYVMKLNSDGEAQWLNTFGGEATDQPVRDVGNDVAVDSAGNVYVAGSFAGSVDFDPRKDRVQRLKAKESTDGFLVKYSSAGRFRSVYGYGGRSYDALTHVVVDSNDDVIVAGYFKGQNFDADPTSGEQILEARPTEDDDDDPHFADVFVEKLSKGGVEWVTRLAGRRTEFVSDMQLDSSDNLILTGSFCDDANFGAGGGGAVALSSVRGQRDFKDRNDDDRKDSYDGFLWKVAPGGQTIFATKLGDKEDDFSAGMSLGSDDSILLTGRFRGEVDFDPGSGESLLTALGLADVFITAFNSDGTAQV